MISYSHCFNHSIRESNNDEEAPPLLLLDGMFWLLLAPLLVLFVDKEEEVTVPLPFDTMGYVAVLEFRLVIDDEVVLRLSVQWIRGRVRVGVIASGQWIWRGHSGASLLLKRNWLGDSFGNTFR